VPDRRTAVIDLGSNSFRLVVFTAENGWWKRTDEIYEAVRIGEGMAETGALGEQPMRRALATIELFVHFLRAAHLEPAHVEAVATSAIRSASNREDFLRRAEQAGLQVRVLSEEDEARAGYRAAVNSTSLRDGAVLDLGGGSLQLVQVEQREATQLRSWPLGAVRMTERFLADGGPASKKQLRALREHVTAELAGAPWIASSGDRLVGIGGTIRNLAVAAQIASGLPTFGVQGFVLAPEVLDELIERLAAVPAAERGKVPGIKQARADLILAGATTVKAVLDHGGFPGVEVTEAGLREGVFFERYLAPGGLFPDVRTASVRNLEAQAQSQGAVAPAHVEHVVRLALALFDDLAAAGIHAGDRTERELLWAAAMLHDIGMAIDYDDHHKHSKYLILNEALPGFSQRETALVAQIARYHRKGTPSLDELAPLGAKGDRERVTRCAALLRLAEQLDRSRDQLIRSVHATVDDGVLMLDLEGDGDASLARWAAARQGDVVERAFDRRLVVR
jgi:exopolyphosphatase/guanosine-5'-triphosphate,3'-diphosphate pyrophosphatase